MWSVVFGDEVGCNVVGSKGVGTVSPGGVGRCETIDCVGARRVGKFRVDVEGGQGSDDFGGGGGGGDVVEGVVRG